MAMQITGIRTQFFDNDGNPLAGGLVYTLEAGTTTAKATYKDAALSIANENPIKLDQAGKADIYLSGIYKIRVTSDDGFYSDTVDNVSQVATAENVIILDRKIADVETNAQTSIRERVRKFINKYDLFNAVGDDNEVVLVKGKPFSYDAQLPRKNHNGGTIISPTVPWANSVDDYLQAVGDTQSQQLGCWVYVGANVTFEMFGANGVDNDYLAVKHAFDYVNGLNKKVSTNLPRVVMKGEGSIEINTSCDLYNTVFDCEDWQGRFNITSDHVPVIHDAQSTVVRDFKSSSSIGAGASVARGWSHTEGLNDSFIIINTTQDFYNYRGDAQKRVELNRHTKEGVLLSPFKYSMQGVDIESIEVRKTDSIRKRITLNIDVGNNDTNLNYVYVTANNIEIIAHFIQDKPNTNTNPTYIMFSHCHKVKADLNFQWVNRSAHSSGFTYNFSMQHCYDVDIVANGEGDGWGANGSNLCQRVVFRNSTLNRIDFHKPFVEYLKIIDCNIGDWGVLVTGIGDLHLIRPRFTLRQLANLNKSGIIRTRPDTGGFVDGDLIVENAVINADAGSADVSLFDCDSGNRPHIADSPIDYSFFRNIFIDGLSVYTDDLYTRLRVFLAFDNVHLKICESIKIENAHGNIAFTAKSEGRTLRADKLNVTLRDCTAYQVSMVGNTDSEINAVISNVQPASNDLKIEATHAGNINIDNCTITSFDFYSGGSTQFVNKLNVSNSIVRQTTLTTFDGKTDKNELTFNNVFFNVADPSAIQRDCRFNNCTFETGISLSINATNIYTRDGLAEQQSLRLEITDGAKKTDAVITLPSKSSSCIAQYVDSSSNIQTFSVARSSNGSLTHTLGSKLTGVTIV